MRCCIFTVLFVTTVGFMNCDSLAQSNDRQLSDYSSRRNAISKPVNLIRHQYYDQDSAADTSTFQVDENAPGIAPSESNTPTPLIQPPQIDASSSGTPDYDFSTPSVVEPDLNFDDEIVSPALQNSPTPNDLSEFNSPGCDYDAFGLGYDSCGCDLCRGASHKELFPTCNGWHFGGWLQAGIHDNSTGLLNTRPDELNLHQGWFTLERQAGDCCCGWDWGIRFDAVYGTDAYALQSFGNNPDRWDFQNGQDHGSYAWAIPQLYAEINSGSWNLKAGHFLADFNVETYRSPTNFFYSRSYASILSSPSTLTGFVASYDTGCNIWSAGYTSGWDTGFDQFADGGAFYGGVKRRLSNNSSLSYTTSAGDFGRRGDGYAHSIIYDLNFCCRWNYAFETSYLQSDLIDGGRNDNAGVAQYLTYRWSNKIDLGQRLEWWKSDINGVGSQSTYAYSAGLNYRVNSNIVIRPEFRYNWGAQFNNAAMRTAVLGIDAVVRF